MPLSEDNYILVEDISKKRHSLGVLDTVGSTVEEKIAAYVSTYEVPDHSVLTESALASNQDFMDDLAASEWVDIRQERDKRLLHCDWTQGADAPLTAQEVTDWATYRGELRDVPADQSAVTTYAAIVWPTPPA